MLSPLWYRSAVEAMERTDDWKADRYVNDCVARDIHHRDLPALRSERLKQYREMVSRHSPDRFPPA
jgi:hypothetical protein